MNVHIMYIHTKVHKVTYFVDWPLVGLALRRLAFVRGSVDLDPWWID